MTAAKRLVFTVTSGRSGTAYLTHLLNDLPEIICEHEPEPFFQALLPQARQNPDLAKQFLADSKLPFIQALPGHTYIETSHYFAKGFIDPLLDLGIVPDLILLERDARAVASSWFLLGAAIKSLLEGKISRQIIGPNEPNFLPAPNWRSWNDYQLCYWYALETKRRMAHYAKLVAGHGGKAHAVTLEKLVHGEDYKELLTWLGVPSAVVEMRLRDHEARQHIINEKKELKNTKGRVAELVVLKLDRLEAAVRHDCGLDEAINSLNTVSHLA